MAERRDRIDFYDPHTWTRLSSTVPPCKGVNHADWSADGRWFLVTCEFSGQILKVDTATGDLLGVLDLPPGSMPQDLRLTPSGDAFYVADMMHGGLWVLSADGSRVVGSIPTGVGAHGVYPSRDGRLMYVSNRGRTAGDEYRRSRPGDGSVSVVDPSAEQGDRHLVHPGRRVTRHGRRLGRRAPPVAVGSLRRRGVRHRHRHR